MKHLYIIGAIIVLMLTFACLSIASAQEVSIDSIDSQIQNSDNQLFASKLESRPSRRPELPFNYTVTTPFTYCICVIK